MQIECKSFCREWLLILTRVRKKDKDDKTKQKKSLKNKTRIILSN